MKSIGKILIFLSAAVMIAGTAAIVAASIEWPDRIGQFEQTSPVYTESVEAGTAEEDLDLPETLRAVIPLEETETGEDSFVQAEPETEEWETYGYKAPGNADELYGSGETVIYTMEQEDGTISYRVYGSLDGSENMWFGSDESGSLTGVIRDIPVTWNGTYDPDTPGEYIFTAGFSGYSYDGNRPYAVITVTGGASEEDGTVPEEGNPAENGEDQAISTLAATSGTIYVSGDGTGDGTSQNDPAAFSQDLLDGLNGSATLVLVDDIELSGSLTVPAGADVTITDDGTARTLSTGSAITGGNIITVGDGAALTLRTSGDDDSLLTFKGKAFTSATRFFLVEGSLSIEGGTIRDFSSAHSASSCILVRNGEFVMSGGVITNNSVSNQWTGILVVNGESEATISGGSLTGNTVYSHQSATVLVLAGVFSASGNSSLQPYMQGDPSLTMTGGIISDNTSPSTGSAASASCGVLVGNPIVGGNGYGSEATFTMAGGTISDNGTSYCGGGVFVCGAGNFYMEDGEITGNSALVGGGVAVYDMYIYAMGQMGYEDLDAAEAAGYTLEYWAGTVHCPARFVMTGGTISGNSAESGSETISDNGCGGGVYIASDTCEIRAGYITGNNAASQGGGIYVGSVPYTLRMYNTLITGNEAGILGGGLWFCPTGDATLTVTSGSAVYGNTADSDGDGDSTDDTDAAGDDFVAVPQEDKTHTVNLADRMLGGGEVGWYRDGGVSGTDTDSSTSNVLGTADGTDRYDPDNPGERLTGNVDVTGGVAYKAVVSENAAALAEHYATVYVTGNSSQRGGGIGANGAVVIGEEDEWTLEVTKDWGGIAEEFQKPVTIRLVIGGYELDAVELNAENGWTASFTQLPNPDTLGDFEITVIEEGDAYKAVYRETERDDGEKLLSITVENGLFTGPGLISGMPWRDTDGDGIQDEGELDDTFDSMVVSLYRYNVETEEYEAVLGTSTDGETEVDVPLAVTIRHGDNDGSSNYVVLIDGVYYTVTATSTSDGGYEFSGLPEGTYRVDFVADDIPMGSFTGSPENQGEDTSADSDAGYIYVDRDGNEYDKGEEYGQWLSYACIEGIVISTAEGG